MSMRIEIPKIKNTKESSILESKNNCIIIIGANGSGKSHFAAYIEKRILKKIIKALIFCAFQPKEY